MTNVYVVTEWIDYGDDYDESVAGCFSTYQLAMDAISKYWTDFLEDAKANLESLSKKTNYNMPWQKEKEAIFLTRGLKINEAVLDEFGETRQIYTTKGRVEDFDV